ncbi:reversion-inducing cysteine-rich protein with Kazal motifs [Diachasmimorpha longicaudata]|uniref:reversion-inducing cysteine-rich protein with Kazal motifs n=1 Tax=Diachasmimorpha longicaudata TaxID=58733 RepID=UPI0030B8F37D
MWTLGFIFVQLWIFGDMTNSFIGTTQEMSCCSDATGSCRNVCSQISLVTLGADSTARENSTRQLQEFCSSGLTRFWTCVNSTLDEAVKNEDWSGRQCCQLAQYPICRSTCALAGAREDLKGSCRLSDEPEFYTCLERREDGEKCCNNVANATCRAVCRELFDKPRKPSSLKLYRSKGCFHQIPKCLKNVAEASSAENSKQYLHCCNEAPDVPCLDACRQVLLSAVTIKAIMDTLVEKCPPVQLHSPFWSCFLQATPTKPSRLPLDIGKLGCCSRAASATCQELCWRAFQADWEAASLQLESECLPSGAEGELRRCLEDADEPCEMGCTGLSYCSNFNNRPTTLFRTCTAESDATARHEVDHWARGAIIRGLGLPVRVDPSCPAESLKAAVCFLQLRPCEPQVHETRLCRNDCIDLLTNCVDWSLAAVTQSAISLCSRLSPARPEMPCISLKPFLNPILPEKERITNPCRHSHCGKSEVCVPQRYAADNTAAYQCHPGCSLGEMSHLQVPLNSWVQIPREDQTGCFRICQCTLNGIEKCRNLNCLPVNSCFIQNRYIPHRTKFYLECKPCLCFEGEITCSRRPCGDQRLPSLPCDCLAHYVPVCGRSGVTLASSCIAKCRGLEKDDFEFGSCSSRDPCVGNPCGSGERCVRRARVCLAPIYKPCKQYECVPANCEMPKNVSRMQRRVCDKDHREHSTVCDLVKSGGTLGYWGPCLRECSLRGPVCGINGEVYANECAAWAENTIMDYFGPCMAVGRAGEGCGDAVICPAIPEGCPGVIPPGACCRVCGAAARVFYSRKQLDRVYYMMNEERDKEAVTLEALLSALGRQVQISECVLRGGMTPEGDIFIIIQPTSKSPTLLEHRACLAEIEKIVTRIAEKSPKVMAEVPLGSLTGAEIIDEMPSSCSTWRTSMALILLPFLIIGVIT